MFCNIQNYYCCAVIIAEKLNVLLFRFRVNHLELTSVTLKLVWDAVCFIIPISVPLDDHISVNAPSRYIQPLFIVPSLSIITVSIEAPSLLVLLVAFISILLGLNQVTMEKSHVVYDDDQVVS